MRKEILLRDENIKPNERIKSAEEPVCKQHTVSVPAAAVLS